MTKLFLASSLSQVGTRFQEFVGRNLHGLRVLFITTASEVEPDTSFVDWTRDYFRKVGVIIIEFTVTGKSEREIKQAIDTCDVIYLEGGNTYFLLQQLRLTGADQVLDAAVHQGKLLAATSAGSIVCGPDISPIGLLDDPKQASKLDSTTGLGWMNRVILPHYGPSRAEGVKKIQDEFGKRFQLQTLTDKQAIAIVGDNERLVKEN